MRRMSAAGWSRVAAAADATVEFVMSRRGKPKAKYAGRTFTLDARSDQRYRWRCDVRQCRSRLTTDLYGNRHMVYRFRDHDEDQHRRVASERKRRGATYRQQGRDVEPKNKESRNRPRWNKGLQFFLSCLSISIGLGNVWRFPTLAYQNGGGAFLIPYFILLFVVGKPVYFLELAIGQFSGKGGVKTWECVPGFKGISVAQFVTSFYILVAYNYIMALCLFYLFASMQSPLPWSNCDPQWSDENCFHQSMFNATLNVTENATSSSEQFFRNYALNDSGEFKLPTAFDWRMALCLSLSWLIQGVSTIKGVHSIGKVAYITSTFPYVVLVSLLVVTLLQEGAANGLVALFVPQWSKILEIQVWFKACEQSFFSLGIGMGVLTMYSSYNDFKHNVSRDAFLISMADTATSLLAGAVVFSTLGALAHQLGLQDISQVLKGTSDLGLAFVTYPEALSRISFVPQLWSVLFFFMLFLLGLGSGVSNIQLMVAVLEDQYPRLQELKGCTVLAICAVCFGTGLFLCTDVSLPCVGVNVTLQSLRIAYAKLCVRYSTYRCLRICCGRCYCACVIRPNWPRVLLRHSGWKNICGDIGYMLGNPISWYWKITWGVLTPVSLIAIFIYGTATEKPSSSLPPIGQTIGWILAAVAVGQIGLWMAVAFVKAPGSGAFEKFKTTFAASETFGPRDTDVKRDWLLWKASSREFPLNPDVRTASEHTNYAFQVD
ncbi:sodium-dependent nutrient amino acid transporter 1 [Rhipicephalus microplus]|uniref:sodium-dependent nutrient amino acid transporter 1 n=1 Tax=Rhipicephalus microplus TaxID=6941 RepID=UPI003F6DA1DE